MAETFAAIVGAEQELGAALCRRAAEAGCLVLAGGRTPENIQAIAPMLREHGSEASTQVVD